MTTQQNNTSMASAKYEDLPMALEVKHIKEILGCGLRQAYDLVNSGQFHVARVGAKVKVSKKVFFEWFEGTEQKTS